MMPSQGGNHDQNSEVVMLEKSTIELNIEDASRFMVGCLKGMIVDQEDPRKAFSYYGYDLYLPRVMRQFVQTKLAIADSNPGEIERHLEEVSNEFYTAAWELSRRGILRPGVSRIGRQVTDDGSAGNGYSVTPFGKKWISEATDEIFIPTSPDRFSLMLEPFTKQFGSAFGERADQASLCYSAHCYLACCAMCGAAAESILLYLATQKDGDEEKVLKIYNTSGGRGRITKIVEQDLNETLRASLRFARSISLRYKLSLARFAVDFICGLRFAVLRRYL